MDKISKGLISLVLASLLAGPFTTVVAQMDQAAGLESVQEEIPVEEFSESVESTIQLSESADNIEEEPVDESTNESSTEEDVTVGLINLNIKDGIKADDLALLKEGRANPWLMKLDWERINPYLAQLDEASHQEAIDGLTQSQMVLSVNGSEMSRVKLDESTQATFDITKSLPKGTVLEFDIPEIKAEAFTLSFDTLKIVVEGVAEEVIVIEDALRPWDLAAMEAGKKGKWSIEVVEEVVFDSIQSYTNINQEQVMKRLAECEITMSVDGELYSKLLIGDVGVATFDILDDLPEGSVVAFSIGDIAWQEENGLEFKLEIAPLVVEVVGMEEKPMTASNMEVLTTATTEITMNAGEWINWNDLEFKDEQVNGKTTTKVSGTINVNEIDEKIKAIPNNSYSGTDHFYTMNQIATKGKLYVKINNALITEYGYGVNYKILPRPLGRIEFSFELDRKIEDSDKITFHFGPDEDSGRVEVQRYLFDWFRTHYVNFIPFETTRFKVSHDRTNILSDAIIIDSTIEASTKVIKGSIDMDNISANLINIKLLESIDISVDNILDSLSGALNGRNINLRIYQGDSLVKIDKETIIQNLTFKFDISDIDLNVGDKLVISIGSFLLKVRVDGNLKATIGTSFSEKELYVEDIELTSVPPTINFGSMPFTYQGVQDKAATNGIEIKLTDNRSAEGADWELSAQASGDLLNGASIKFENGELSSDEDLSATENSPITLFVGDDKQSFAEYQKPTTGGYVGIVKWTLSYAAEDILLTIPPEVMMKLSDDTYHMNISWILTKGP
ncbi:WxL domain-containing protein [Ruoffia tabacinasalis]|uniref:WxL domain-containing protein n=1 Tax=Ruoffia tabacinasalis TaxID=87458 RepID=A0ABS0LLJ5_9LACT|nr:WxL domain-containing protein [Ruoffia tabacinasalis]MBG9979141.1 WxL domain-containing protein [Ruoffia tabacinasalis]